MSQAAPNYAIKFGTKNIRNFVCTGNSLIQCSLFDTSSMTTGGFTQDNLVVGNTVISGTSNYSQLLRGNFTLDEAVEPPSTGKYNILKWSRYINSGADFGYVNATPSYMTATDENGIANNATTVLATAVGNRIRYNSLDTNNTQKFYTFSVWMKLDEIGRAHV